MRRAFAFAVALALTFAFAFARDAGATPNERVAYSLDDESLLACEDPGLSKKSLALRDKSERKDVRLARAPRVNQPPEPPLTIRNLWTHESYAVAPDGSLARESFDHLLRCHHTNQTTAMDDTLLPILVQAAKKFRVAFIDVVSGYRAAKYQLTLRKKGHEVARDSEHPKGNAIDFRLPDVPTKILLRFVKSLRKGGVGFYPESHFVHADTGRVRFWKGH